MFLQCTSSFPTISLKKKKKKETTSQIKSLSKNKLIGNKFELSTTSILFDYQNPLPSLKGVGPGQINKTKGDHMTTKQLKNMSSEF